MKSIFLKCAILLCLFSVSILRGQSQTPKTTSQKEVKKTVKKKKKAVQNHDDRTISVPTGFSDKQASQQLPVMTFDTKFHDFGTIKKGEITPIFVYNFTNTGNAPLDIAQVTGCDCSEFDWTRTTVAPNEKGFISVKYNSNKTESEEFRKKLDKYLDIVLKQTHPKTGYVLVESVKFNVFVAD